MSTQNSILGRLGDVRKARVDQRQTRMLCYAPNNSITTNKRDVVFFSSISCGGKRSLHLHLHFLNMLVEQYEYSY